MIRSCAGSSGSVASGPWEGASGRGSGRSRITDQASGSARYCDPEASVGSAISSHGRPWTAYDELRMTMCRAPCSRARSTAWAQQRLRAPEKSALKSAAPTRGRFGSGTKLLVVGARVPGARHSGFTTNEPVATTAPSSTCAVTSCRSGSSSTGSMVTTSRAGSSRPGVTYSDTSFLNRAMSLLPLPSPVPVWSGEDRPAAELSITCERAMAGGLIPRWVGQLGGVSAGRSRRDRRHCRPSRPRRELTAGPGSLRGHLLVELRPPRRAEGDPESRRLLGAQLDREAVGVVEHEEVGARRAVVQVTAELGEPSAEGPSEGVLLLREHGDDVVGVLGHLGVVGRIDTRDRPDDLRQEVLLDAQGEGVAHRPSHEPAQHVALRLVRRPHPVDGEEGGAAEVVGDDTHGVRLVRVGPAGERLEPLDDRAEQADPEDVGGVERGSGDALETSAVVDDPTRERLEAGAGAAVLHEDGVAELDEAAAVTVRVAAGAVGRVVLDVREEVEHLGVGAAGLADGHVLRAVRPRPPVARAVEDDARVARAHL